MDRNQYLGALNYYLTPMPEAQRYELMRRYDAHFAYGAQSGKTEEEIAYELGDPRALAAQLLGAGFDGAGPWTAKPKPDFARMLGVGLLLGFFNLAIALPVGASLWAALLSFGAVALALILSPAMVFVDWIANDIYFPATLFVTIAMSGVGLLLAALFAYLLKAWMYATVAYARWNIRTWRGR